MGKPPHYRVYLLRCWQEHSQRRHAQASWRFSLEEPQAGQRRGFPNLSSLTAFLAKSLAGECVEPDRNLEEL